MKEDTKYNFDYSLIPIGYYDEIANKRKGIRSFWHYLKFRRIIDLFEINGNSILDIGCFAGTFLGMIPETVYKNQIGIDILPDQVKYANEKYGNDFRHFMSYSDLDDLEGLQANFFDCITIIEVLEHLDSKQINDILSFCSQKLIPGGSLIITTPNYISLWPLLEFLLNKISKVKYKEQHITQFTYGNIEKKISEIYEDIFLKFKLDFKTTSHMFTPLVAFFSYYTATKISGLVRHNQWKNPGGSIVIARFVKTGQ